MARKASARALGTLVLVGSFAALEAAAEGQAAQAWKPPSTKRWIEVKTDRFTVYSEVGEEPTRKLALRLERFRRALGHISSGFRLDAPVPTAMFVFRDDESYTPYKLDDDGHPLNVSGYFLPRPFGNYITLDGSAGDEPLSIVYHEYFHSVVDSTVGDLPTWLDEGLAEYHSTFRERGGSTTVEVGHPIEDHLAVIDTGEPLRWDDVYRATPRSRVYNESKRQGAFYAQSWLLVHYLCADPERAKSLGKYLSLLRDGTDDDTAFSQAFGTTREELGQAAWRYRQTGSRHLWFDLGEQAARVETTVRPLTESEVLFRLGDLLAHQGQADAAARHLEAARGAGWPAGSIDAALGYSAYADNDRARARELWSRAIAAGATTNEAPVLLAEMILDDYRKSPAWAAAPKTTGAQVLEARKLAQAALARNPQEFHALLTLAHTYYLGAEDVAPGVTAIESARALRPLSSELLWLQACLLGRQERAAQAWTLIARGLAPRSAEAAKDAGECATFGTIVAARDRADGGDREGARGVLAAAIEATPDEGQRARLRSADATLASGGAIRFREPERDDTAERFNDAVSLANARKYDEALARLEALVRDCEDQTHPACEKARTTAAEIRKVATSNRFVRKYNDAIAKANDGDRKGAVALLRELESEVTDPELLADVQETLRQLGAKVTKKP